MPTPQQQIQAINNAALSVIKRLPRILGTEVVRYSNQRFREQNWDGVPWRPFKHPNLKANRGRKLLMRSGRGRRSIRITTITATSVTIGAEGYMQIHNDGFNGPQTVKEHTRNIKYKSQYTDLTTTDKKGRYKTRTKTEAYQTKVKGFVRRMRMPRRRFLGDSPYMRRNLLRITTAEFNRALRPFMKITK